ncbi:uncharacterized protein N7496_005203 [Penicillium cataractarum]|uniref:Transcription factor domain-containing protein n=1 Tax=Penicillium cataractarum TaxID=2100454 RepID=A0A9W9SIC0_9EURO|nr:uncharacterized protein N7496_005203 [Penicillium cataractarum]KAJ5377794.1 hypothetical protein N7496_005203 [Penicillium cataractarum]
MYNLGTAFYSGSKIGLIDVRSYHTMSEATAGVRYLMYYHQQGLDEAERQLLQRLFWLLFAGSCTVDILGRLPISILAQDQLDAFARPLEKSDEQLDPPVAQEDCQEWHGNYTSYVPGLNCLSNLYLIWQEARSTNSSNPVETYLKGLQRVMDNFPPELRWRGGLSRPSNVTYGHDVQVANLFVTSLHIRSNLIQRFGTPEIRLKEHPKIIDDLLEVLYHLPQAVFDANGSSLVPKIRDMGAAYLEQIRMTGLERSDRDDESQGKLTRLLQKLDELDYQQVID